MRLVCRPTPLLLLAGLLIFGLLGVRFRAVEPLPQDTGAAGAWQKIRKLQTTASVLHTTAHPDDEHGGLLALLSRGQGVRTTLLSLTRGESGDNAIGSELFDTLGLVRTEELAVAGRYYGLDEQYFATFADYGFSKRLDEALEKWNREAVLADVVRVIRIERPLVIVSRFQGNARDGHGQHQAAGALTLDAFRAAADPKRFPEQLLEGLRPWQARKLYVGGARSDEAWTVEVDPGLYDPVLGESYQNFARRGLSFQRSQNGGRFVPTSGSATAYYVRAAAASDTLPRPSEATARAASGPATPTSAPNGRSGHPAGTAGAAGNTGASQAGATRASGPAGAVTDGAAAVKEASFFDGIDTTLPGIYRALGLREPAGANAALVAIDQQVQQAVAAFSLTNPAAAAPALARGLAATRIALVKLGGDPDVGYMLRLKERQFTDAITAALGISVTGLALPAGTAEAGGSGAASPFATAPTLGPTLGPTLAPVVPGQTIGVRASFVARTAAPITLRGLDLVLPAGWTAKGGNPGLASRPIENRPVLQRFDVAIPANAPPSRAPFYRDSLEMLRYKVDDANRHRPAAAPLVLVRAEYEIEGTIVETTAPVLRRESALPYGYELRELTIVPAIAVTMTPGQAITGASGLRKPLVLTVEVTNNQPREASGAVALTLPQPDWRADPATQPFRLGPGEHGRVSFAVSMPSVKPTSYRIDATASSDGRTFGEGYEVLQHRDLETRYFYKPASTTVQAMHVAIYPNLTVGYVMGVGDEVPAAIAQLGATVSLLDAQALANAPLDRFDAIVLGTRAYGVRPDLRAANARLLDYAKNGGNLIVLYNTQEFDPATQAPYRASLPGNAEEVSEEDAAVLILVPTHPVFMRPNRITPADFNGWVEQRGSKFWTEWDSAYAPLLESHDRDQPPQRGGWLYARVGKGHYSYVAYAFHRQLPYGVPGAYRLFANLLSLGKS